MNCSFANSQKSNVSNCSTNRYAATDKFAHTILSWYSTHKRELPWRNVPDPYRVWVSEIILQQTRVAQGYDYYIRFIEAFPTVEKLASATEDEVLRLWQGLGYYSRARNMQVAARQIVENGRFPDTYDTIKGLKGVGSYTAAAISSFAFGLPYAVVDGNVYRVLSRYFGINVPIDTNAGKQHFAQFAQELLPAKQVADYNQGIMDFGALQCVPSSPQCDVCPLVDSCVSFANKKVELFPVRERRLRVTNRYLIYIKVVTPEGIWLCKRSGKDIWKGLYEFPLLEYDTHVPFTEVVKHPFLNVLPNGGTWKTLKQGIKHKLTHRTLWIDIYSLTFPFAVNAPDGYICVSEQDFQAQAYAIPRPLVNM